MAAKTGVSGLEFLAFADVEESVCQDVDAIRHCGHLPPGVVAWGAVYDVDTGALRLVAPPPDV